MKLGYRGHFLPVCIAPCYSATVAIKRELQAQGHWQQKEKYCTDFPQSVCLFYGKMAEFDQKL